MRSPPPPALFRHSGAAPWPLPCRSKTLRTSRCPCITDHPAGGFFKKHRDTPRGDPGFVGSLVVALPVAHKGGALRVEHGKVAVEYAWGPAAVSPWGHELSTAHLARSNCKLPPALGDPCAASACSQQAYRLLPIPFCFCQRPTPPCPGIAGRGRGAVGGLLP